MIDPAMWKRAAPALALVSQMTSSVLGGAIVGVWVDRRFGIEPWATLVLVGGGFALSVRHLLLFLKQQQPPDAPPDPPAP